jgi:hypothetical protein
MYLGLVLFTDIQCHKTNTSLTPCGPFCLILSSLPHTQVSIYQNPGTYCIGAWLDPKAILGVLEEINVSCACRKRNPGPSISQLRQYTDYAIRSRCCISVLLWTCKRNVEIRSQPDVALLFTVTSSGQKTNAISITSLVSHHQPLNCLFSWRYNPLWLYFHSPVAGFSLLVFEVS